MLSHTQFYCRLFAACSLLLMLPTAGCRKYENQSIEFESWSFNKETYAMASTDAITIAYPLEGSGTINISSVKIQSAEPSISGAFIQKDTNHVPNVFLTLRTNNTPAGTYPVRITMINADGSFIERVAKVDIVNFAKLLRDSTLRYYAEDSLDEKPFEPRWARTQYQYSFKVTHKPGAPTNQFVFSSLGHIRDVGTIDDVIIDVDSVTGKMVAPQQWVGISGFSGYGQLTKFDGYNKVKGYFIYFYKSSYGTEFEGHLSF
jgi:hypothetical protein